MAAIPSPQYGLESNASKVLIPSIIFLAISPLFVGVRLWSRKRLHARIGSDDWTICISLLFGMLSAAVLVAACSNGYGRHMSTLDQESKSNALMYFYLSQFTYKISINMTKASILLLYLRLFVQKPFKITCWILFSFVVVYGVATTLGSILQCTPISRTWNQSIEGVCLNTTIFWYSNAAVSILGDVMILALPMPLIYQLKLRLNQRVSLMFVFSLGVFIIVTSILRMTSLDTTSTSSDPTYDCEATMWTVLEMNVALICACLPMFRAPLAALFPRLFPDSINSHGAYSAGGLSRQATDKQDWAPHGSNQISKDVNLTSVVTARDNESEEYILQGQNESTNHAGSNTGIQKTTHVTVMYDDDVGSVSGSEIRNNTK